MTYGIHEIDEAKLAGYEKSVEADKLLAAGRIGEARQKMAEAAELDKAYAVRAELIGREDARKIRVGAAVRKILVPFLVQAGFGIDGGGGWSEGKYLKRRKNKAEQTVLIGRDKFGYRLSVLAARIPDSDKCEFFNLRTIGIRSDSLAYKTQAELEAACVRWCELIERHIFPWWEEGRAPGE
ncbi:MAG: hypothetical protein JW748_14305 [Anaerolineales bacterium]|nr:hypothetical protein [Anaerolineales bacterium]